MRYYTPSGISLMHNIHGRGVKEIKERLIQDGYMPVFVMPNIFLDIIHPLRNGGMKDKELSKFFLELYHLANATGQIGKAFTYMDKDDKNPEYDGRYKIIYGLKWLYRNHMQSKSKNRKKLIKYVISALDKGQTIRDVFAAHYFDEIVLSLLDLASMNGDYPKILLKNSEYFDAKAGYKKNVLGAIAYPSFLFFLLFLAFLVFLYYIIPTFASFFSQFSHINDSTRNTLNIFMYIRNVFVYYAAFLGIVFVLLASNIWDIKTKIMSCVMNMPQVGNIFRYNYLHWFFYQFAVMISSGLTITAILNYFGRNISNQFFGHKINMIYAKLMDGFTLHESLDNADFLEEEAVDSIKYAEIGGFLPETVMRLSMEFKDKSNLSLKIFTGGLFFLAMASVVIFLFLMFFVLLLPLIQGMISLPGNY